MDSGQKHLDKVTLAKDITCSRCGGNEGFFIDHGDTWSCCNEECIKINSGLLDNGKFSFEIKNCYTCFPHLEKQDLDTFRGISSKEVDYSKFGIEPHLLNASFDKCTQEREVQKSFVDSTCVKRGVTLLSGKNGIGKTYMAVCAMKIFITKNQSCRFLSFPKLRLQWLQLKKCGDSELNFLDSLCSCDFLVLDDMGLTTPTDAFLDFVYLVIDKRHNLPKTTVITTNLIGAQFIEKFGEAIFSRVASGNILKMEGKDKRISWQ